MHVTHSLTHSQLTRSLAGLTHSPLPQSTLKLSDRPWSGRRNALISNSSIQTKPKPNPLPPRPHDNIGSLTNLSFPLFTNLTGT